jgi:DNA-binding winged helix-turn-helix (wHTH) protein
VEVVGQPVRLTATEFDLLAYLMRNPGRVLEPRSIAKQVWGVGASEGLNTLRIFIGRLRRKLGDDAQRATTIASVRGHGYKFVLPVVEVADESRIGISQPGPVEYLDALGQFASALATSVDEVTMAHLLVETIGANRVADAVAVHSRTGEKLHLVAHQGFSDRWVQAVGEVPLDPRFASVHAVMAASPVLVSTLSPQRYQRTFEMCRDEEPGVYLFLPVDAGDLPDVCVGLVRRSGVPFDATALGFARALTRVYGAQCSARRRAVAGGYNAAVPSETRVDRTPAAISGAQQRTGQRPPHGRLG